MPRVSAECNHGCLPRIGLILFYTHCRTNGELAEAG